MVLKAGITESLFDLCWYTSLSKRDTESMSKVRPWSVEPRAKGINVECNRPFLCISFCEVMAPWKLLIVFLRATCVSMVPVEFFRI